MFGAWKNASGQVAVEELFVHLEKSFSGCTSFEFDLLEAEVLGDVAYTVGFEHTSASINGEPSTYTLRVTQIYRREGGEWKVVHRHGSPSDGGSGRRVSQKGPAVDRRGVHYSSRPKSPGRAVASNFAPAEAV